MIIIVGIGITIKAIRSYKLPFKTPIILVSFNLFIGTAVY